MRSNKKLSANKSNYSLSKNLLTVCLIVLIVSLVIGVLVWACLYASTLFKPSDARQLIGANAGLKLSDITDASGRVVLVDYPDYDVDSYVELCDYKSMTVDAVEKTVLTEDEIMDAALGYIEYYGKYDKITEGTVSEGDLVIASFTSTVNGEVIDDYTQKDVRFYVVDDIDPHEFYENLVGATVGEPVEFDVKQMSAEADVETAEVVHTSVTVSAICKVPEFTDENIARITDGEYKTVDAFLTYVKDVTEAHKNEEYTSKLTEEILTKLTEESKFKTIPQALLRWSVAAQVARYQTAADVAGTSLEKYVVSSGSASSVDDLLYNATNTATSAVQQYAVLDAIAKAEGITIDESDEADAEAIEKRVSVLSDSFGVQNRAELEAVYGKENLLHDVLNMKVITWLLENVKQK